MKSHCWGKHWSRETPSRKSEHPWLGSAWSTEFILSLCRSRETDLEVLQSLRPPVQHQNDPRSSFCKNSQPQCHHLRSCGPGMCFVFKLAKGFWSNFCNPLHQGPNTLVWISSDSEKTLWKQPGFTVKAPPFFSSFLTWPVPLLKYYSYFIIIFMISILVIILTTTKWNKMFKYPFIPTHP